MTTHAFSPAPHYTISGIGPYDVPYAYGAAGELKVATVSDGISQALNAADYEVVPEGPASSGTVFLTAAAAAAHDGATLEIRRNTEVVQLWQGLASTATSLEDQLDQITRALQDARTDAATSLRVSGTWRTSLAELLADSLLSYEPGQINTAGAGARITTLAEGFAYEVAESSATDHHLETAGGVKLYVLPVAGEAYHLAAFGIANDGVTDDFAKLRQAADACRDNAIANLILPAGEIYCAQELEFDWQGGIYGAKGSPFKGTASCTRLCFPPGTNGIRFCRAATSTSGGWADDSILQDVQIECRGDNSDSTGHGVVMDARGVCVRVSVQGFPGDGFHIEATAAATPPKNANLWTLERCRSNRNGRDGFFIDGADVNAGEAIGCDANVNGRINFYDSSFLGNTWIAAHSAMPGMRAYGTGSDGKRYRCIRDHVSAENTLPVTGADWQSFWEEWSDGPDRPAIRTGMRYHESRAGQESSYPFLHYLTDNANARNVFIGCYAEGATGVTGGGSRIVRPSSILGDSIGKVEPQTGPVALRPGTSAISATSHTEAGDTVHSTLGNTKGLLAAWSCRFGNAGVTWRLQYDKAGGFWEFNGNNLHATRSFVIYDEANARGAPVGLMDFGRMGFAVGERRHTAAASVPSGGSYARGDIVYSTSPSAGGKAGWICTTSGTAGSTAVFKPFGAIDA